MAGISGLGTTFNLPNYTGVLYGLTPADTPFFSAIGGLTGGEETFTKDFEWSFYDLRDASATAQRLEGADAPTSEERVRSNADNVTEIHQETVGVSYTKLAATAQKNGLNNEAPNNVKNELDWQTTQMLKQMVRDIEVTFLSGTYAKPANNSTARRTRGILEAITTNVADAATVDLFTNDETNDRAANLRELILDLMQDAWANGGLQEGETATLMTNATGKRRLTEAFVRGEGYQETSRSVGGVNVQTIETDFGTLNLMLNRHLPADQLLVVSLEECAPVFLNIPGKGHFFAEPLAKTGANEKVMFYGEVGLRYGDERKHAKVINIDWAAAPA